MNYTTVEQSIFLEKVIDPNTADVYYENGNKEQPTIKLDSYGHIKTNDDIPCWSVGALIDLLPNEIEYNGVTCYLQLDKNWISYEGYDRYDSSVMVQPVVYRDAPLVELLYKMICWLSSIRVL